jgi:hypothetical protein
MLRDFEKIYGSRKTRATGECRGDIGEGHLEKRRHYDLSWG